MSFINAVVRTMLNVLIGRCERSDIKSLRTNHACKLKEQLGKYETDVLSRKRIAHICREILRAESMSQSYNYSFSQKKAIYRYPIWVVKILSSSDEEYIPTNFTMEKLATIIDCASNSMIEKVLDDV